MHLSNDQKKRPLSVIEKINLRAGQTVVLNSVSSQFQVIFVKLMTKVHELFFFSIDSKIFSQTRDVFFVIVYQL